MILIDELNRIIIEVNQFNTENLYKKIQNMQWQVF